MSDREASEFDEIREELSRRPGSKFGWVVYRCTYGDDARWAEFMDLLTGYVKVEAEISSNLDLMGSLDWAVQEDRALDEATPAAVRRCVAAQIFFIHHSGQLLITSFHAAGHRLTISQTFSAMGC
jgi:hypothetical protein